MQFFLLTTQNIGPALGYDIEIIAGLYTFGRDFQIHVPMTNRAVTEVLDMVPVTCNAFLVYDLPDGRQRVSPAFIDAENVHTYCAVILPGSTPYPGVDFSLIERLTLAYETFKCEDDGHQDYRVQITKGVPNFNQILIDPEPTPGCKCLVCKASQSMEEEDEQRPRSGYGIDPSLN